MKHGGNHLIVRTALIEKGYVDDGALCHCVRELTQGCVLQAGAAALQSRVLRVAESARRRDGGQVVGHDARRESGLGLGRSVGWWGTWQGESVQHIPYGATQPSTPYRGHSPDAAIALTATQMSEALEVSSSEIYLVHALLLLLHKPLAGSLRYTLAQLILPRRIF